MELNAYKRNVFKTLSIKPAKEGLRKVARKTATTNIAHGIVGLKSETGELLQGLAPFILGTQLNDAMRKNAREELGGICYYLTVLCKTLKVKMPGSGKKVLLKGMTMTEAILQIDSIATDLLDQYKKSFYGRDLDLAKITELLVPLPLLVYGLCYTMFQQPASVLMDGNIAKLSIRYPDGFFDAAARHNNDHAAEMTAMTEATTATVTAKAKNVPAKKAPGKTPKKVSAEATQ